MKSLRPISTKELLSFLPAFLPLVIILIVITGATYLIYGNLLPVYSGQRTEAAKFNLQLLDSHLLWKGPRTPSSEDIKIVSLTLTDLESVKIQANDREQNASIETYARILSKVLKTSPKHVFVHWKPLVEMTQKQVSEFHDILEKSGKKVSFYTNENNFEYTSSQFSKFSDVKLAEFCSGERYSVCPYNENWTFWNIVDLYGKFNKSSSADMLSKNLSLDFEAFILNLADGKSFKKSSFQDVLTASKANLSEKFNGKYVFIGNELIQGIRGMTKPDQIGRVKSVHSTQASDPRLSGLPIHIYWAEIASMFMDGDTIDVASSKITEFLKWLASFLMLLAAFRFTPVAALGFYLAQLFVINLTITGLLKWQHFYIPAFDILYYISISFLIGGFIKLIFESILERLNIIQYKHVAEQSDLKTNFISLISHNLNTPVAKMISMLEIVLNSKADDIPQGKLRPILKNASEIQVTVKAVLAANRLEEKKTNQDPLTPHRFEEDIRYDVTPVLQRIGIDLSHEDSSELTEQIFPIDKKALSTAVICYTVLLTERQSQGSSTFFLTSEFDMTNKEIHLQWNTSNTSPLLAEKPDPSQFLEEACRSFIKSFRAYYQCSETLKEDAQEEGYNLDLKIILPTSAAPQQKQLS